MLTQDSLTRLKGLKARMEAENEYADAVVKGSSARYGFAVLDDGREIFIPPDEMLKAFPADRVRVCIRPDKDNKTAAAIEHLINCPLGEFTGRCVRRGKALFVEPDLPQLSRWMFIPPSARGAVQAGDYLRCAVSRHPVQDGRPQAKILDILGNTATVGIENRYTAAKYQLPDSWPAPATAQLEQILQSQAQQPASAGPQSESRRDLTNLEFVSIDATRTQDIDDALYAEASRDGWNLYVAIADPASFIAADSPLEQAIAARGSSVYFHGAAIPMIPESLAQNTCALVENQPRPALVCKISVSDAGAVGNFEFMEATIRSRAKLNYMSVARYLNGNYDELMSHATPLEALYQVYRKLHQHRATAELVMADRPEYHWFLNPQKCIDNISRHQKLLSQKLVEECMIAANRCCALFLQAHRCGGPFVCHPGFRQDRHKEVKRFLERFLPDYSECDLDDVANYREIMRGLSQTDSALPLRTMVNRLLARSTLDTQVGPHMGLGLSCYSTCTSPLRKYSDFLAHRQIKAILHGGACLQLSPAQLDELRAQLARGRQASLEAERWLQCGYIQQHVGTEFDARITRINSSGCTARLCEWGIEGYIDVRKEPENFSYDRWTATLTSPNRTFQLEQLIRVKVARVDVWKREITLAPIAAAPGAIATAV